MAREKKDVRRDKDYEALQERIRLRFINTAHVMWGRELSELTPTEVYQTVAATAKQFITDKWIKTNNTYMQKQEKQVYYFSIEFQIGRAHV